MRPVVVMPDAEAAAVTFLTEQLAARGEPYAAGVAVSTRVPNPIPLPYIQVRRSGGVGDGLVLDRPRIDGLVWHHTDADRIDLARLAYALLLAVAGDLAGGVRLYAANPFLAPLQVPDPIDNSRCAAMFSVELVTRGTQV